MSHTPTPEQAEIIAAAREGHDLTIEAGAGTGKTSTLKMLARDAGRRRGAYLAYNRSIATDAAKDFPTSVTCKTAHSFAYGAVGRQYAHRLNGPRVPARQAAIILGINEPVKVGETMLAPQQLARLVTETIQRFCYSDDRTVQRMHVPLVNGLDKPGQAELAKYLTPVAQKAWDADLTHLDGQLRFTHDMYLKLWILSDPVIHADYVLLDEAQDSNPAVAGLVSRQPAQRILVGDRAQAIYGWRGATDAMASFDGRRFQLSQSFRFGQAVADEANKWLGLLDNTDLRLTGYSRIPSRVGPVDEPDAVLCRSNAGAIIRVIDALGQGRQPALVGGGNDIRRMAEAAERLQAGAPTDHPDLFAFHTWREVQEYVEMDAGGSDLKVFVRLIDRYGPREVMRVCDALVDERYADVVVSTAHKAKGREWSTVLIADDFQEPKPREDGSVRLAADEVMLAYVAVTRAQRQLDRYGLAWVDRYAAGPAPEQVVLPDAPDDPAGEPEPLVDTAYGPLPAHEAASLAEHGYVTCRCPVLAVSRG
ncbi:UvrD-helicase domain-containing protein [Micromonospora endolithica]|uniref:ATP-dependent helicase n=1 Tax=Micromonospora endolithica TaxID=230091 RepID=A0A3A9YSI9_9ACTN|nr:UvrD-helicase domain-containing protein [Micromonospora endolithica]RKN38474.1 ATP-dependent helicase [Micromonospora endolithica]TWJ23102.1 UvrD-like helicase family protein [Micromonospora endolithica]